jgi:glutathione peroxidase
MKITDITVRGLNEEEVSLSKYAGKVLLVVNTATKCGFTPQLTELQQLYLDYNNQGLEILDFPCNQFLHQAPGSNAEINEFCTLKYHTTFPRFAKINVNGKDASPLYNFLKGEKGSEFFGSIKWNFTKFLINKDGEVVKRYAPNVKPSSIIEDIKKLISN